MTENIQGAFTAVSSEIISKLLNLNYVTKMGWKSTHLPFPNFKAKFLLAFQERSESIFEEFLPGFLSIGEKKSIQSCNEGFVDGLRVFDREGNEWVDIICCGAAPCIHKSR